MIVLKKLVPVAMFFAISMCFLPFGLAQEIQNDSGGSGDPTEDSDASNREQGTRRIIIGLATMPLGASGLTDIHASDWQNYGLKSQDPSSQEGRIALPLSLGNVSGQSVGIRLGAEYILGPKLSGIAEISATAGTLQGINVSVGIDYYVVMKPKWRVAVAPRIGLIGAQLDFGTVQQIPGFTPPVITPIGTFDDGESLTAMMVGLSVNVGAVFEYDLTDSLAIRADLGFQYGIFTGVTVTAGTVTLPEGDPALVQPDGSSTPANLDGASGDSIGLYGMVGVNWRAF